MGIAAYYGLVTFGLAMTGLLVGALLFDVDLARIWDRVTEKLTRRSTPPARTLSTTAHQHEVTNE